MFWNWDCSARGCECQDSRRELCCLTVGCVESHPAATSPGWSQTRGQRISPRIRDESVMGPSLDNRKYELTSTTATSDISVWTFSRGTSSRKSRNSTSEVKSVNLQYDYRSETLQYVIPFVAAFHIESLKLLILMILVIMFSTARLSKISKELSWL